MPAVLNLAGITGESQIANHQREIDIMSFAWGESNSQFPVASKFKQFSIVKSFDSSSPGLVQKYRDGTVIATAVVTLKSQVAPGLFLDAVYKFENVYVMSIQIKGKGGAGEPPTESVSFRFEKGGTPEDREEKE
jgi:type VI protein secretion system component Hcp